MDGVARGVYRLFHGRGAGAGGGGGGGWGKGVSMEDVWGCLADGFWWEISCR